MHLIVILFFSQMGFSSNNSLLYQGKNYDITSIARRSTYLSIDTISAFSKSITITNLVALFKNTNHSSSHILLPHLLEFQKIENEAIHFLYIQLHSCETVALSRDTSCSIQSPSRNFLFYLLLDMSDICCCRLASNFIFLNDSFSLEPIGSGTESIRCSRFDFCCTATLSLFFSHSVLAIESICF